MLILMTFSTWEWWQPAVLMIHCNRPRLPLRSLHPTPDHDEVYLCLNDDDDGDDESHLIVHYGIDKNCHTVFGEDLKIEQQWVDFFIFSKFKNNFLNFFLHLNKLKNMFSEIFYLFWYDKKWHWQKLSHCLWWWSEDWTAMSEPFLVLSVSDS